eukprot:TRINITY_DN10809_c0_g1_i2.p1 TRINITY_DN10809_c0_g1~~TRINITY_DN10809_c0_g1_i2.p1  ORF type:complete len:637 (+),score=179.83 TRINITY_DN10809_c0_g1_i2:91-2001(+)
MPGVKKLGTLGVRGATPTGGAAVRPKKSESPCAGNRARKADSPDDAALDGSGGKGTGRAGARGLATSQRGPPPRSRSAAKGRLGLAARRDSDEAFLPQKQRTTSGQRPPGGGASTWLPPQGSPGSSINYGHAKRVQPRRPGERAPAMGRAAPSPAGAKQSEGRRDSAQLAISTPPVIFDDHSRRKRRISPVHAKGRGTPSEPSPPSTPTGADAKAAGGAAGLMRELMDEMRQPDPAVKPPPMPISQAQDPDSSWQDTIQNFGIVKNELTINTQVELSHTDVGAVYKGEYQTLDVAVKVLLAGRRAQTAKAEWREEVALLSRLRHPNVLQMLGAVFDPSAGLAIVTEFCAEGTLRKQVWETAYGDTSASWTKRLMSPPPPWTSRLEVLLQIARGMAYLHYKKVFHRDLKASNVLLSSGIAKVCGFGMSAARRDAEMSLRLHSAAPSPSRPGAGGNTLHQSFAVVEQNIMRTRRRHAVPTQASPRLEDGSDESGTFAYVAPEVWPGLPSSKPFSNAADVYSFGVLLIEVVAARVPFDDVPSGQEPKVARQIARGTARPRMPRKVGSKAVPESIRRMCKLCLSHDAERRPSFRELIEQLRDDVHSGDYRFQECCVPFAADEPGDEEPVEEVDTAEAGEY